MCVLSCTDAMLLRTAHCCWLHALKVAREVEKSAHHGKGGAAKKRWGFKAPVTMYMLPFWAEVFPGATYIHVVLGN